jgi:hypothetical protein
MKKGGAEDQLAWMIGRPKDKKKCIAEDSFFTRSPVI